MTISMSTERAFEKDWGANISLEDDPRKHRRGNWRSETRVEEKPERMH